LLFAAQYAHPYHLQPKNNSISRVLTSSSASPSTAQLNPSLEQQSAQHNALIKTTPSSIKGDTSAVLQTALEAKNGTGPHPAGSVIQVNQ